MNRKAIGESIKMHRMHLGLSEAALCQELSLCMPEYMTWENGTAIPPKDKIVRLASYFNVSVESILTASYKRRKKGETERTMINEYVPDEQFVKYYSPDQEMRFKDLFSPVKLMSILLKLPKNESADKKNFLFNMHWRKHTKEEFKAVFKTQKIESEDRVLGINSPWVFFRVFLIVLAVIIAFFITNLHIGDYHFGVILSIILVPLSVLFYIYEVNYPRNISLPKVLLIVLVGGAMSIGLVILVRKIVGYEFTYVLGNIMTGVIEELAKAVAAYIFILIFKPKYLLSGLLIGAAVGTGFSIIETFMYVFEYVEDTDTVFKLTLALMRGLLSIGGGHIFWAALAGGVLTMVIGNGSAAPYKLLNKNYWIILLICI
jgi:RsiW-degrading membrane proteinase PrsW (M82 family)